MKLDFNSTNIIALYREVGLCNPKDEFYKQRIRKHQQILSYITQFKTIFNKLSAKRDIVLLDCGCGKSYLSFLLYEYFHSIERRKIKIIGVDNNLELINKCKQSAKELGFHNMQFCHADIEDFKVDDAIDIAYSLHACNTATDQMIAKGVDLGARYILSVSCCQHDSRRNIRKHPLKSVTRYPAYKERLADMLGDSMRALLLQQVGYGVKIFEFVAAEQTPKNIMLRAVKSSAKNEERENSLHEYREIVKMFNFAPALEDLLEKRKR